MTQELGKVVTCEICGRQQFAKAIGEGETDGGYTRWTKFEALDGWDELFVFRDLRYKDVCPACHKRVKDAALDEVAAIRREHD